MSAIYKTWDEASVTSFQDHLDRTMIREYRILCGSLRFTLGVTGLATWIWSNFPSAEVQQTKDFITVELVDLFS